MGDKNPKKMKKKKKTEMKPTAGQAPINPDAELIKKPRKEK